MPSPKTESTELSVAFGLLRIDPLRAGGSSDIVKRFEGTLSDDKFSDYLQIYQNDASYYQRFFALGVGLCKSPAFRQTQIRSLRWEGPLHQGRTVSTPKDLVAANTSISVKASSNVVYNLSPQALFIELPSGAAGRRRSSSWYLTVTPGQYQSLYDSWRRGHLPFLPTDVRQYEGLAARDKKSFSEKVRRIGAPAIGDDFQEKYLALCHEVARQSAIRFNDAIADAAKRGILTHVHEHVVRTFFRIGESEYLLCGLDKGTEFAVLVPDLTSFKRRWSVDQVTAEPDLVREQSVVQFRLSVRDKEQRKEYTLGFRAEIRWSHGKFAGNPEAKLYKNFLWTDVPFFTNIYEPTPYIELGVLGKGGFGIVVEAIMPKTGLRVAVKKFERDTIGVTSEEHENLQRFRREVDIQSRLKHPNVLPVLEHDLTCDVPWFASPLARTSLAEEINSLHGDDRRIIHIFKQVLAGVRYAHENSVVHRDIKPSNILLFDNDVAKLGDFGLGKPLGQGRDIAGLTHSSDNSMGSLPYAAPEQLESFRDADCRSDIYSLGKTLLHVVTGKIPISAKVADSGAGGYSSFIQQCIREDPEERYQTMADVIEAFSNLAASASDLEIASSASWHTAQAEDAQ